MSTIKMSQVDVETPAPQSGTDAHPPFTLDEGPGARAAIGLVMPSTDQIAGMELNTLLDMDGVVVHHSRVPIDTELSPEALAAMEEHLGGAVERTVPDAPLDVIAYGCTSAAVVIGEDKVFARIHEVRPGTPCTTPIGAARAALAAFGAKRIGVLTPYPEDVNRLMQTHIEEHGFEISAFHSFDLESAEDIARVSVDSVRRAALELGRRDDVEAVFVSCTNLRFAPVVQSIEREIGKPVTSSNHAMGWHCLRLAGIDDRLPHGALYALGL